MSILKILKPPTTAAAMISSSLHAGMGRVKACRVEGGASLGCVSPIDLDVQAGSVICSSGAVPDLPHAVQIV